MDACARVVAVRFDVDPGDGRRSSGPKPGEWIAHDFKFHDGEVLPALRLRYTTIGEPSGEPVLILHGTGGSGAGLLTPEFAGRLFGPGQPLDAARYFIILPDESATEARPSRPTASR